MLPLVLRPAVPADALRLAQILIDSRRVHVVHAPLAHTDDEVRAWVQAVLVPGGGVTVAQQGPEMLGLMAVAIEHAPVEPAPLPVGWIEQLYLDPAVTGRGIGSMLLAHALATLPAPVRLWTFQASTGARRFYERGGFVPLQFTDGADNEQRCPDVLYERWTAPGPRVHLRRLQPRDLDAFCAYRGDADVGRWQGGSPMPPAQALVFLQLMQAAPPLQVGEWLQLGIARHDRPGVGGVGGVGDVGGLGGMGGVGTSGKEAGGGSASIEGGPDSDDRLIGDIGLLRHDAARLEIGFTLAAGSQGQGLAAEAIGLCLGWLWTLPGLQQVLATTDARNAPSARLLQRLGFARVAVRETTFRGEDCTEWDFVLTRSG